VHYNAKAKELNAMSWTYVMKCDVYLSTYIHTSIRPSVSIRASLHTHRMTRIRFGWFSPIFSKAMLQVIESADHLCGRHVLANQQPFLPPLWMVLGHVFQKCSIEDDI